MDLVRTKEGFFSSPCRFNFEDGFHLVFMGTYGPMLDVKCGKRRMGEVMGGSLVH